MRDEGYKIPVVVISTEGNQQVVIEAVKLGAKGYIRKPFSANKVDEVLEKIIP
jgi:two-component system, chemotaxis family, chemotaxis protein CheY